MQTASKFVILSARRSGSSWLTSILNNLENTRAYGDLFFRRKRVPGQKRWDSEFAYPRFFETYHHGRLVRPFALFSYLNRLYRQPGAVGCKLMYSYLFKYPEILAYLTVRRIRVVHLVRRNHLDVLISRRIRRELKQAHFTLGDPRPDNIRIELNPQTIVDELRELERFVIITRRLLRWCGSPHIEVVYEDLCGDPAQFNAIWNFLRIAPPDGVLRSNLVKIRQGMHADVIRNYAEVKTALSRSPYAQLIT